MKIRYRDTPKYYKAKRKQWIEWADAICEEFAAMGYSLSVRQIYYQFVGRGHLRENTEALYNQMKVLLTDARYTGHIDWEYIVDRTRVLRENSHWESPADFLTRTANEYSFDLRSDQPRYVEVWIEKDALIDIVASVCKPRDVPYFSCRGYASASAMWDAAGRLLKEWAKNKRPITIIYLGDHDPSGKDMGDRDIGKRLREFMVAEGFAGKLTVEVAALTREQIEQYDLPPMPAKTSDARHNGYETAHGNEAWELDALPPNVLESIIRTAVVDATDTGLWNAAVAKLKQQREQLVDAAQAFVESEE